MYGSSSTGGKDGLLFGRPAALDAWGHVRQGWWLHRLDPVRTACRQVSVINIGILHTREGHLYNVYYTCHSRKKKRRPYIQIIEIISHMICSGTSWPVWPRWCWSTRSPTWKSSSAASLRAMELTCDLSSAMNSYFNKLNKDFEILQGIQGCGISEKLKQVGRSPNCLFKSNFATKSFF